MANKSWSLELAFAEVSAQGKPLALTNDQNKFGGCFLGILGHFSAFFLGCLDFLVLQMQALAWSFESRLRGALRSEQNKDVGGDFSEHFGSLFCVFSVAGWLGSRATWVSGAAWAASACLGRRG